MLHHEVRGTGPFIVFVHAGVADSRMWDFQRDHLAGDHTVITLDLRGFGRSPVIETYADADDVLGVLDRLGVRTTTAVGASYGGHVVLQAATKAPERFERLVLFAPPVDGVEPTEDRRAFAAEEDRLLEAGDVAGATWLNVRTSLGPSASDEARRLLFEMQEHAFRVQLEAGDVDNHEYDVRPEVLRMPVKVFAGAHDSEYFRRCAAKLAADVPDGEYVELAWAGHLPAMERPQETLALIRAAL